VEQFLLAPAAQGREVPGQSILAHYPMVHIFKPLLLLVLAAFYAMPAFAQTQATQTSLPEPYSPYKWEVGTDMLWLINKNQLPAQSVFARYNYQTAAGKSRGVRLRLGLDYMRLDSLQLRDRDPAADKAIQPFVRAGYEFQQTTGRRVLFYGADLHFSYSRLSFNRVISHTETMWIWYDRTIEAGPVLFIGYKYFITPYLSLSTELSAQAFYRGRRFAGNEYTINTGHPMSWSHFKADQLKFNLIPLTVFNLSYHF
jgi:hypothetical protein